MKPLPFVEAIAFAKTQAVVLPDVYYGERIGLARAQARTISSLAGVDQIQAVFDVLDKHLANGGTFKSFRNDIASNKIAVGLPKHRLELVFRNNIQTAYNAGRWQQFQQSKTSHPYLRYSAVNDGRTRPSHRAMHGHIARVDDVWWKTHMPQNGHRCFLPNTRVAAHAEIGLKSFYSGEAVEIISAGGARLSVTVNHPILTDKGFIKAGELKKGDKLICDGRNIERIALSGNMDDKQVIPTIEDLFNSLSFEGSRFFNASSFDLYGDARFFKNKVYATGAKSKLMGGGKPFTFPVFLKNIFKAGYGVSIGEFPFDSFSSLYKSEIFIAKTVCFQSIFNKTSTKTNFFSNIIRRIKLHTHHFYSVIIGFIFTCRRFFPCGRTLTSNSSFPFLLDFFPFNKLRFSSASLLESKVPQYSCDNVARNVKTDRKRKNRSPLVIKILKLISIFRKPFTRSRISARVASSSAFDPMVIKDAVKVGFPNPELAKDILDWNVGLVVLDDVITINRFNYDGHVYDLQTDNGLIIAGGIFASNCRCTAIALTEKQAKRYGIPSKPPANAQPDKGWDYNAGQSPMEGLKQSAEHKKTTVDKKLVKAVEQAINTEHAPVSSAIVPLGYKRIAKHVLGVIDAVHTDGKLPLIPLKRVSTGKYYGAFSRQGMKASHINLSSSGDQQAFTLAHEIGHFIDLEGIGDKGGFASQTSMMDGVMTALENSNLYGELESIILNKNSTLKIAKYVGYLLSEKELWARAYAQWIAIKSRDIVLLEQLEILRSTSNIKTQWDNVDFQPIADAIDKMLKNMGWLNEKK